MGWLDAAFQTVVPMVLGVPLERVQVGAETSVVVQCVEDPARPGQLMLDIRLHRRDSQDGARAAQPTAAGFLIALHEAERLSGAIVRVAARGAEAALWMDGRP